MAIVRQEGAAGTPRSPILVPGQLDPVCSPFGPAANWVQAERGANSTRCRSSRHSPFHRSWGECLSTHLSQPFSRVGSASSSTTPSGPAKTSKLRERGIERDQQEKGTTAWNGQCELQLGSQVGGYYPLPIYRPFGQGP